MINGGKINKYTGYCNDCTQKAQRCIQCTQAGFLGVPSWYKITASKQFELYDSAVQQWGIPAQEGMFIEEIGEVLTALNKVKRVRNGIDHRGFVAELVDLEIMLEQMKLIHSDKISWNLIKDRKIRKLLNYIQDVPTE